MVKRDGLALWPAQRVALNTTNSSQQMIEAMHLCGREMEARSLAEILDGSYVDKDSAMS